MCFIQYNSFPFKILDSFINPISNLSEGTYTATVKDDNSCWSNPTSFYVDQNTEIAAKTVQVWINSKPHHELLLYNCCFIYGSISSKVTTNKKWTYVTLNIYG